MGKAVFDGSDRELALHMELRLKTPGRKEVAIDPAEPKSQDIDERRAPQSRQITRKANPCVLRNQDLKKAFSAESVSCGFSSGRK